ncbi:hypothetical protein HanIR_Chr04g0184931 [Helianthus annuus]|nr:hypothetical protein HanIR_Chr04g0184931 [Helianthus annuus]
MFIELQATMGNNTVTKFQLINNMNVINELGRNTNTILNRIPPLGTVNRSVFHTSQRHRSCRLCRPPTAALVCQRWKSTCDKPRREVYVCLMFFFRLGFFRFKVGVGFRFAGGEEKRKL